MDGDSFFREGRAGTFFGEGGAGTPQQEASWAMQVAAENLLDKLADALGRDEHRARRLAEQAAALPFDDHEQVWPGVFMAGQTLFDDVSDMVEEWPEDDVSWIDVLAEALETADGWARIELLHVVGVLQHDSRLLAVTEMEAARLKRLTGGAELDPFGPSEKVPEDERVDYVLEVVRLREDLLFRLAQRLDEI